MQTQYLPDVVKRIMLLLIYYNIIVMLLYVNLVMSLDNLLSLSQMSCSELNMGGRVALYPRAQVPGPGPGVLSILHILIFSLFPKTHDSTNQSFLCVEVGVLEQGNH